MDHTTPLAFVPLSHLSREAEPIVARTCWHGVRQVITVNGVAVAALVPLDDLDRPQEHPGGQGRGAAPDGAAEIPSKEFATA